jgi:hypothetical protein
MPHSRAQSPSYMRSTEHDDGRGVREWIAPQLQIKIWPLNENNNAKCAVSQ